MNEGYFSVGQVGGEQNHRLTIDEMPSHNHTTSTFDKTIHSYYFLTSSPGGYYFNPNSISTSAGGDNPHNNLPPYYALAYIMKL